MSVESVDIHRFFFALMPALSPDQSASIIERGAELLNDAAGLTSGSDPYYIRDAQPESLFEAIPLAAARQGCRRYADKGGNYPERRAARAERACRPYLDYLEYGSPPELDLPFRGGQCFGVEYLFDFTYTDNNGDRTTAGLSTTFQLVGAATETRGDGFIRVGYNRRNSPGTAPQFIQVVLNFPGNTASPAISNVRLQSGASDTCGNPTPIYTPPTPPPTPGPPREPFTIAPNIDIDIEVEVNIDGSLTVNIGTGPITIDPFDEPPDGDGEPGGGDGEPGGGGPVPGDVGAPGAAGTAGAGIDAEGEAPPGTVLTGIKVALITSPPSPSQFKAGIFRGSAYIYMGTAQGLDMDFAGQMLSTNQFIFAEKDNLTHWKVSANLGYSWSVTPYYREV